MTQHETRPCADPQDIRAATEAVDLAEEAATRAGVRVRILASLRDLQAADDLFSEIWRPGTANAPVSLEVLRALSKSGNYVAGAFEDERLVGASAAFFEPPETKAMHSHITGVDSHRRSRNVGLSLKLHQRAWALDHGVAAISWTFDPLVERNAYFNVRRLAARPVEYLTNFYGSMGDAINRGEDSDRLLVHWDIASSRVAEAVTRATAPSFPPGDRSCVLRAAADGRPVVHDAASGLVTVGVPNDIEQWRQTSPDHARAWRSALREVLGGLLTAGATVEDYLPSEGYLLDLTRVTRPRERS